MFCLFFDTFQPSVAYKSVAYKKNSCIRFGFINDLLELGVTISQDAWL